MEQVTILSFHPDGASSCPAPGRACFDFGMPATGRQLMQLPSSGHVDSAATASWVARRRGGGGCAAPGSDRQPRIPNHRQQPGRRQGDYHDGDISPDGRLLALGMASGGQPLGSIQRAGTCRAAYRKLLRPLSAGRSRACTPAAPADCTAGRSRAAARAANELRVWARHRSWRCPSFRCICADRDGRRLAVVSDVTGRGERGLLMDLATNAVQGELLAHPQAS